MPRTSTLRLLWCLPALLALVGCATSREVRTSGQFLERSVDVAGITHRYQVFVPATAAGGAHPPVILFLHGSGERGSDNQAQVPVGIGAYVRQHMDDFPAIVVFPQAPADTEWNQIVDVVTVQLEAATEEFGGDRDRTYLTGLSMGGFGTWDLALRAPDRFAAVVPICGGLVSPGRPSMNVAAVAGEADPYAAAARRLKDMPTWIFHGARDDVVPPEYSRRMHAALQAAGAKDVRYTEFPNAQHNSWDPAYLETPALWSWLFAQRRRD
jgi:predicted peptidase